MTLRGPLDPVVDQILVAWMVAHAVERGLGWGELALETGLPGFSDGIDFGRDPFQRGQLDAFWRDGTPIGEVFEALYEPCANDTQPK